MEHFPSVQRREDGAGEPACSTSPDGAASESTHKSGSGDGYIYHRVTKLDTLAGLAIRYGVAVADIKRANGILSDNAMFARDCVKIPTGELPIGEDAQVLFARLMSGYGRDASLNACERKAPGTVSINQLPGSPPASRCSLLGSAGGSDAVEDPGTPYSRRSDKSSSEPGDVELMQRSMLNSDSGTRDAAVGSAHGFSSDRVRRRGRADGLSGGGGGGSGSSSRPTRSSVSAAAAVAASQLSLLGGQAVGWLSSTAAAAQAALPAAANATCTALQAPPPPRRPGTHSAGVHSDQGGAGAPWRALGSALSQGSSSLVDRIKRAASQPALASPVPGGGGGFGDAADAVLRSGVSRTPSYLCSGPASTGSIDLLARGTALTSLPRKDTKGD